MASMFFILRGIWLGAPGAINVSTVYLIWPTLYIFFTGVLNRLYSLIPYLKAMVLAGLFVILLHFILAFSFLSFLLPLVDWIHASQEAGFGDYTETAGITRLSMLNLSSLLFLLPFLTVSVFLNDSVIFPGIWRYLVRLALMGCIAVFILAGRKGFWVSSIFAIPFFIFVSINIGLFSFRVFIARAAMMSVVILSCIIVSILVLNIDLTGLYDYFADGFNFGDSSNISAWRRAEQFDALIGGWSDNPLLGAGHGASAYDNLGLSDQLWAYELAYLALLFHTGILGFLVYFSAVCWIFIKGIHLMKADRLTIPYLLPTLTGMFAFLIANATNPYLEKFDYIWVIFLPVATINAVLHFSGGRKYVTNSAL